MSAVVALLAAFLGFSLANIGIRIGVARGRCQVVRFLLLRHDRIVGTHAGQEVLEWCDELAAHGAQNAFRGYVDDLPNREDPEWKTEGSPRS